MLGMKLNRKGEKVGITFESFVWFFVLTAASTALGEYVYAEFIEPRIDTSDDDTGEIYVVDHH
jgi:hypothetical protein